MDNKPVVTFTGDLKLFSELQPAIVQGLPQECIEWRRSYGRIPKPVVVEVSFAQFTENCLSFEKTKSLLGQPFLHTYWIECSDIEKYKQSLRNHISEWFASLRSHNIQDWMIIVVEHLDNKKINKTKLLSRTTVLEKLKNDFPSKNGERCVSLLDPFRSDSRAAVSLNGLLLRLRQLLLQAYNTHLNWYEEHVRNQREKRNELGWDFLEFFFLQEELAFAFEMMGVYDDALVQYDELDALFSQFVINSSSSEIPEWLSSYTKPCENWPGVCLLREAMPLLRKKLADRQGSLLDLRSYLFARQCSLLLLLCRPWEMAQRSLPFLHNCVNELRILEIPMQTGAVATWIFLSCLEILQSCERFSDSSQVEAYSLYTVELWAYAREKLHDLGVLCGLMPTMEATSEQLHLVMILTSGMRDGPHDDENPADRQLRLREALSSKESFLSNYLEISELTMGTFKHIGRIRLARLIGKDLAPLYFSIGQHEKAASFLNDMLQIYYQENWLPLIGETQLELASFYEKLSDIPRYVKMCVKIAANHTISSEVRRKCFSEILKHQNYFEEKKKLIMKTDRIFVISNTKISCEDDPSTSENKVDISLTLTSLLPVDINCATISVSFVKETFSNPNVPKRSVQNEQLNLNSSRQRWNNVVEGKPFTKDPLLELVTVQEVKGDGSLVSKVACTNSHQVLFRRESRENHSTVLRREIEINEDDYSLAFVQSDIKLAPGKTSLNISKIGMESGVYRVTQLCIAWEKIHLLYSYPPPSPSIVIVYEPPTIKLQSQCGTPIAGLVQGLELIISSGSAIVPEGSLVTVKTSNGIHILSNESEEWTTENIFKLPNLKRFGSVKVPFNVLAEFGPQRDASMIEYRLTLKWTFSTQTITVSLHFLPPFMTAFKLHTCNEQKFLQVFVHGLTNESFILQHGILQCLDKPDTNLKPLNQPSQRLAVNTDQTALFLWKIEDELSDENLPSRFVFSTEYQSVKFDNSKFLDYKYEFKFGEYRTQYTVRAVVEPPNGSEFCRAGTQCHMTIKIEKGPLASNSVLMYEVIADQSVWTVCGKTAGVTHLADKEPYSVTFDVIPLIGGFLPLPTVRLSKYIPENPSNSQLKESMAPTVKLEPFDPGLVYNWSRAMQAHVLPAINVNSNEA